MIIKSIMVKNFKCLKDVFVDINKEIVLVGNTGAGKTALTDVLWHIQEWFRYPDDKVMDFIGQSDGWDKVKTLDSDKADPIEVDILVRPSAGGEGCFCWRCYRDHVEAWYKGSNEKDDEEWEELKTMFIMMRFHFDIEAKEILAWSKYDKSPVFDEILRKIQTVLPQIEDITFDDLAYYREEIEDDLSVRRYYGDIYFHEKGFDEPFNWLSISPAMQKIVTMAVMTETANSVVVCDEDPAEGLYYKITDVVSLWFKNAAQKKGVQFILTSYSPFFVNAFDPSEVWLVERDVRGKGYSDITHIPRHPFFDISTNPDDYSTWEDYEAAMRNWYFDFISIS